MQLRNKFYAYPVLTDGGNYYENSSFATDVTQSMDGYAIRLSISSVLNDSVLTDMIHENLIQYAHHIECPQTCYRKLYLTSEDHLVVALKDDEVNGDVQVCSFIVAARDIEKYTNPNFSSDYKGFKFDIDKGCVLAIGNSYSIRVNKKRDDLANTSSIFSIAPNMDPLADSMEIDLKKDKIVISLPFKTHGQFVSIQSYQAVQPAMHSMLIIPALIYVLEELKNADLFLFENYRWFRSIRKACSAMNIDLSEENIKNLDIVKTAQKLLNSPIMNGISYLTLGGHNHED